MKASDLMTSLVVTVRADATIEYAAQLMLQYRISGLPVTDSDGAVLGIITESDLLRRAETGTENRHDRWASLLIGPGRLAREYVRTHGRKVAEVMTERVFIVTPETPFADLVALMETKHVKRVPVVDQGRLVGIVSRADVMATLVGLLSKKPAGSATDAEIREKVLAEIDSQPWGPRDGIDVVVTNGVVVLKGMIPDERERAALRVAAENVPGVKAVHAKQRLGEAASDKPSDRLGFRHDHCGPDPARFRSRRNRLRRPRVSDHCRRRSRVAFSPTQPR